MNLRKTLSLATACAATAALMAISACAGIEKTPVAGPRVDDITITSQVKARFLDSPQVDGRVINVKTLDGTVLLTGAAQSHVEKAAASEIALGVSGVRMVQNEITVRQ
jgi:hyperosmotically inducible periplasmic protein